MDRIVIIGGGLAGLTCALQLKAYGYDVTVIEKNRYPFHRVCGEYLSNEALPYLSSFGIDLQTLYPACISKLAVSAVGGKTVAASLDMGGVGISRHKLDNHLYETCVQRGVEFVFGKASEVICRNNGFTIRLTDDMIIDAKLVIGSYGKRSNLDVTTRRDIFYSRSPYTGVKYHIRTDLPADTVQLDLFMGGYCGICRVEDDKYNLCYLTETTNIKRHGTIAEMEQQVLMRNPNIRKYFEGAESLFEKPEVISEISFARKPLVADHILFCGDAAGMITPLCGNGMAMAIHSAKILAECIRESWPVETMTDRTVLENRYTSRWRSAFASRLRTGRLIQDAFRSNAFAGLALSAFSAFPALLRKLVKKTHGKPF